MSEPTRPMINDDERREVAARLRALPIDIYAAFKEWGRDGLFVDANIYDEADYGQIHNAVFGCFPAEHMHPGDYEELRERLADLIDRPTCEMKSIPKSSYRVCSRCGAFVRRDAVTNCTEAIPVRFCPNCDARVVGPNGE